MSKPSEAHTHEAIVALDRDNIETPNGFGFMVSENHVAVFLPEPESTWIEIPRSDFDAMARWYLTGEAPPEKRRKRASAEVEP